MVCDVKQGVLICGSFVYDRELIVLRPAISNGQSQITRITLLAIGGNHSKDQFIIFDFCIPWFGGITDQTSVKVVGTAVYGKMVFFSI